MLVNNVNSWHMVLINTKRYDDAEVAILTGGATYLSAALVTAALSLASVI